MRYIPYKNFFAYGGVEKTFILECLREMNVDIDIPEELMQFWTTYGGGDLYETESFLYPLEHSEIDNVVEFNNRLWSKGLSNRFFVFYSGIFGYGALEKGTSKIYLLNGRDFSIRSELQSFTELRDLLDKEYRDRYPK